MLFIYLASRAVHSSEEIETDDRELIFFSFVIHSFAVHNINLCVQFLFFFFFIYQVASSIDTIEVNPTNVDNLPNDISGKGQEKISQIFHGQKFPKSDDGRSFQSSWIDKYTWIEYSKQQDKVYCYPCRQFGMKSSDVFITGGFNGWKRALSTGQGFQKHETSALHIKSMLSWKEKQLRTKTDQSISNLVNNVVLEKRRYYFKAIVETILFLVSNELPFRGDCDYEGKKNWVCSIVFLIS